MKKCERTAADAKQPADWDPCRYTVTTSRQGNQIVEIKRCLACEHEIVTPVPVAAEVAPPDPNNHFAPKPQSPA